MADVAEKIRIRRTPAPKAYPLFDEPRYEQIGNVIYMMALPARIHEAIITEILGQLWNYLDGKPCKAYSSNIGLDLKASIPLIRDLPSVQKSFIKKGKGKAGESYLLPDISVICDSDESHYSPNGYGGVPKLLVEVSSPSTNKRDLREKLEIYEAIGVGEYWIISDAQNVAVYVLKDGKYVRTKYESVEKPLLIPVSVFPDLTIKLDRERLKP